jgi:hypothetical protein
MNTVCGINKATIMIYEITFATFQMIAIIAMFATKGGFNR